MGVPSSREDLIGKALTEQPDENWATVMAQSDCEGDEQSVADGAVYIRLSGGRRPPKAKGMTSD